MEKEKTRRLKQVATTLNIGTSTIVEYLSAKGFDVDNKPTTKITAEQFNMLAEEYDSSMQDKHVAEKDNISEKPVAILAKKVFPDKRCSCSFSANNEALFKQLCSINGIITSFKQPRSYKLREIAAALDTSTSIIVGVLEKQGYKVDSKPNAKISDEHLKLLTEHFAVEIDASIGLEWALGLDCAVDKYGCSQEDFVGLLDNFKREESKRNTSLFRMAFVHSKRIKQKQQKKLSYPDIKTRIHSILTPKLFHVFAGDDEDNRVATYMLNELLNCTPKLTE